MGKRVLVIGGGASGLIAARGLAEKGCNVVLLEAKERLGGRILTHQSNGAIVELGAEFVHGEGEAMANVLRHARLETIPASEKNRLAKNGRLKEVELWERVGEVIGKIDSHSRDVPFREWLDSTDFDSESKEMALAFVEGFNASDARIIGAHGLLRAEYESEKTGGDKQARVRKGYAALIEALRNDALKHAVQIEMNARVHIVKWEPGRVTVKTEDAREFEAEVAVITLSLGVLKSGRVVFEPSLVHKHDAIEQMRFGNVAKLVFVFKHRWWAAAGLEDDFGFVHAFQEPIPTWWSDSRAPVIIGWAAGPKGEHALNLDPNKLRDYAIDTMGRIFSRSADQIQRDLASFEHYDWRSDPDFCGAYSYLPVNGLDLPKLLAAPIENTLFFAGEATAMNAQMGTVTGAVESGLRVIAEIC